MTDALRKMMILDASMKTQEIEKRFAQIAQMLFGKLAIRKGETKYLFKEIEFYFYNKNHRDIITHPRSSKPLCWYVNDFGGIDLNFASSIEVADKQDCKGKITYKYVLDDNAFFGGILVRQLISEDGSKVLTGPWSCAELFRCHDAIGQDSDFPKLIEQDNGMVGYICEYRKNLLSSKQTVESKVDYILGEYQKHPEKERLYKDFAEFMKKRYRYVRCDTLIHDEDTNEVYFSPWLKDYPEFYGQLTNLLSEMGIESKLLKSTNDFWVRDYMPIQLGRHEFMKYRYYPDYLVNTGKKKYITDCSSVLRGMGITCRSTNLVIDGGNMVPCGPYIVMTDKVFTENGYQKGDQGFQAILESELGHPVIIIPWTMDGDFDAEDTDKYGHADGFIKWCGKNRILMGNHGDEYPEEAASIKKILEDYGFEVTEMRFKNEVSLPCADFNWAYINFLQIGNKIIMPKFNIDEDNIAYQYIHNAFPDCIIRQIDMKEIASEGGAMHCISWNIYRPQ